MIPKEKAKELYSKYKEALAIRNDMKSGANPFVVMCCLILVSQIIEQLDKMHKPEYVSFKHGEYGEDVFDGYELQSYWEDVKTEIGKL